MASRQREEALARSRRATFRPRAGALAPREKNEYRREQEFGHCGARIKIKIYILVCGAYGARAAGAFLLSPHARAIIITFDVQLRAGAFCLACACISLCARDVQCAHVFMSELFLFDEVAGSAVGCARDYSLIMVYYARSG